MQQINLIMHNSFTLDINEHKQGLIYSKATLDADTLDSGLATASQHRRYPRSQIMQQVEAGSSLRQMRQKRKLLEEQYRRISCRLQYQRNKDQKILNKAYEEQNKMYNLKFHEEKKKEQEKKAIQLHDRIKFKEWSKEQQVQKRKEKIETQRRMSLMKEEARKKRQLEMFQRRMSAEKCHSQKLKRQSFEMTKSRHDSVLKMKQEQKIKRKLYMRKKQQLREEGVMEKISRYGDETTKTMRMIQQMKERQQQLQRINKSYGKVLIGILDNFKKLEDL